MSLPGVRTIVSRLVNAFKNTSERTLLLTMAVVVGLLSGAAAVVLKKLVELISSLLMRFIVADSWLYFICPGIGMLLSLLFVKYVVRDNIGHGVTKVLLAISKNESRIKPHNTWTSIAASSVTIGFGGSVGAEAPIVYTGAAIGSNLARVMGLSYRQMTILLGCGAAGAVAGIFKAPMAGVLFTLEILLFNMSMTSVLPLMMSSVTATMVSYIFLGDTVTFANSVTAFSMSNIPFYILLGLFCGFFSLYFIRTTIRVEDRMRRITKPYVRWAFCAAALGVLIFLFPPLFGEGYGSLTDMLNDQTPQSIQMLGVAGNKWLLLGFFVCVLLVKVYATAFTNAGGGVGGTFGPTLLTGGLAGFVLVRLINNLGFIALPEANFVLVGMAGLMAGVMQAPLTAIFLIAEITGGYVLIFPLIITAAVSFATIRVFEKYSIYTKRIAASGELLTHDNDQAVLTLLKTAELVEKDFTTVSIDSTLGDLVEAVSRSHRNIFPIVDGSGKFQGDVQLDDIRQYMFRRELYDKIMVFNIMKEAPALIRNDERMESVMEKFEMTKAWNLPVVDTSGNYLGYVSKSKIFSSYRDQLKQVSHE